MAAASELSSYRFSTDRVLPHERLAMWRDVFGRTIVNLEMRPVGEAPPCVRASMHLLPDLACASVNTSAFHGERTLELARDGGEDIGFVIVRQGTAVVSQRGREVELRSGDAILLRNDEAGAAYFPVESRYISISAPRKILTPIVANLDALSAVKIPAGNPLRLLLSYVGSLDADRGLVTHETRHLIASHIHDLVALSVGATREAAEIANGRGVRAARLRAVKDDILTNLGHRNLSIGMLARRQGISPRYIRKLFDADGMTLSEFVLGQRLARAHRVLADPRFGRLTISAVAFEAGFGDLSYFNRVFRRQYGATPSEIRALGHLG